MDVDPASEEVDLHRLELRYRHARLIEPRAVSQLARSIQRCGQRLACWAVADADRLVLVDGYRRVAALRQLGRDTVQVERLAGDVAQGLIRVLGSAQSRPFAALEEALLLRELVEGLQLSRHEVARRTGRDVSWVQRRLQLLSGLPEVFVEAVRRGRVSTWAAVRIFAPLARANSAHAEQLLASLGEEGLSTRELREWFAQYQRTSRAGRERLVAHPRLFVQARQAAREDEAAAQLRAGVEGACLADLRIVVAVVARLRTRLAGIAEPWPPALVAALHAAGPDLAALVRPR